MLPTKRELARRLIKFVPKNPVLSQLPAVYLKFHEELFSQPKPLHYEVTPGKWKRHPITGIVTPIQNVPIPTMFPPELHNTLLGGEVVVKGFMKRKRMCRRFQHFWVPSLMRTVVHSEILNQHFSVVATRRLIYLVNEHKGFDNYLLENKACDLRTNLAIKMKKAILTALLYNDLPYDDTTNAQLYEKYKQYLIPEDELEWYGLTLTEAKNKVWQMKEVERTKRVPLKQKFRLELLEELRETALDESTRTSDADTSSKGWISKIKNPFAKS